MNCPTKTNCSSLTFIASVAVLLLFIVNALLILGNRGLQEEVMNKQNDLGGKNTKIQQNATFGDVNRGLIQALVTAAITRKDEQIRALLIQNDVKLTPPGQSATSPTK
jgi:hypothetical protein